jgi:FkbM family methyltransferase
MLSHVRTYLRDRINRLLEGWFGLRVYSVRAHGRDDCVDISNSGTQLRIIFDVGANVGQSAKKFRAAFPHARIYSFEPEPRCYQELLLSTSGDPNIQCFQLALGDRAGSSTIYRTEHSTTSSLIEPDHYLDRVAVDIETLDDFVDRKGIDRIDLLKIDVEGFDLAVLQGGKKMLSANQIPLVLVEVGFTKGDSRHVLLDDIRDYLAPFGYFVYGIYDQNREWSGEPRLRFSNVCFANPSAFDSGPSIGKPH